ATAASCSLPSINGCLPHAPPADHWSSLALVSACRGQLLLWEPRPPSATKSETKALGATLMRIDLKKVKAENASLRSRLAAIDSGLDECRLRHFEHPWAWSQIRRGLTFERNRVQRRLEDFTFARRCVGGRPRGLVVMLSFRSLAGKGEENAE